MKQTGLKVTKVDSLEAKRSARRDKKKQAQAKKSMSGESFDRQDSMATSVEASTVMIEPRKKFRPPRGSIRKAAE